MSDAVVAVVQGIIEYLSRLVRGHRLDVSSERLGRDRIVLRAKMPHS